MAINKLIDSNSYFTSNISLEYILKRLVDDNYKDAQAKNKSQDDKIIEQNKYSYIIQEPNKNIKYINNKHQFKQDNNENQNQKEQRNQLNDINSNLNLVFQKNKAKTYNPKHKVVKKYNLHKIIDNNQSNIISDTITEQNECNDNQYKTNKDKNNTSLQEYKDENIQEIYKDENKYNHKDKYNQENQQLVINIKDESIKLNTNNQKEDHNTTEEVESKLQISNHQDNNYDNQQNNIYNTNKDNKLLKKYKKRLNKINQNNQITSKQNNRIIEKTDRQWKKYIYYNIQRMINHLNNKDDAIKAIHRYKNIISPKWINSNLLLSKKNIVDASQGIIDIGVDEIDHNLVQYIYQLAINNNNDSIDQFTYHLRITTDQLITKYKMSYPKKTYPKIINEIKWILNFILKHVYKLYSTNIQTNKKPVYNDHNIKNMIEEFKKLQNTKQSDQNILDFFLSFDQQSIADLIHLYTGQLSKINEQTALLFV